MQSIFGGIESKAYTVGKGGGDDGAASYHLLILIKKIYGARNGMLLCRTLILVFANGIARVQLHVHINL